MSLNSHKPWRMCSTAGLLVAVLLQVSWAQERPKKIVEQNERGWSDPGFRMEKRARTTPNGRTVFETYAVQANQLMAPGMGSEFDKAIEALRGAEGDEAKSDAQDHLHDLLTEYFSEDMKRREADLKSMEQRLKKLREQLTERGEKKNEIVDLQMKVLVNEANGLGFFGNGSDSRQIPNPWFFYNPSGLPQPSSVEQGATYVQPLAPAATTPSQPTLPIAAPLGPPRDPEPTQLFDPNDRSR